MQVQIVLPATINSKIYSPSSGHLPFNDDLGKTIQLKSDEPAQTVDIHTPVLRSEVETTMRYTSSAKRSCHLRDCRSVTPTISKRRRVCLESVNERPSPSIWANCDMAQLFLVSLIGCLAFSKALRRVLSCGQIQALRSDVRWSWCLALLSVVNKAYHHWSS